MRTLKALQKRLDTFFVQSGVSMDRDAAGFYKYPIIVFGNKTDLSSQRQVSAKEAAQVLNQMGLRHHRETNAKDYATVEAAFYEIAQVAAEEAASRPFRPIDLSVGLHEPDHVHTGCCAIL
jgi:GTPase SAR1 family protein